MQDGTNNLLLEDSWGWGGGRYTILCYGGPGGSPPNLQCDNNTFRRVVLRQGPTQSSSGNPQASISLYYGASNLIENVLLIDGVASSDSSNAAFYVTAHPQPGNSHNNRYRGIIALNNKGRGFYLDCTDGVCDNVDVRDSVFWDAKEGGMVHASQPAQGGSCNNGVFDRNTVGKNIGHGFEIYACPNVTVTNSAFYMNTGVGLTAGSSSFTAAHHNGFFSNTGGARQNVAAGTGDVTTNPGILYITRIESGSPYATAGVGGSIGANVINRYENAVLTATPLWPWAFEDRIRTEMCAGVSTGWCAGTKTLTRYVWEYLGNTIPAGIYPP